MVSPVAFFLSVLASGLFVYALLWIVAKWAIANEEEREEEKKTLEAVRKLKRQDCQEPELEPDRRPDYEKVDAAAD